MSNQHDDHEVGETPDPTAARAARDEMLAGLHDDLAAKLLDSATGSRRAPEVRGEG